MKKQKCITLSIVFSVLMGGIQAMPICLNHNNALCSCVESVLPASVNASKIKVGDKVLGMTVTHVDYENESYLKLEFAGELCMSAMIQYNPMEGAVECMSQGVLSQVEIDGEVHELFDMIAISNATDFKESLSATDKNKINKGKRIITKLCFKNPTFELDLNSKGRMSYGTGLWIKK